MYPVRRPEQSKSHQLSPQYWLQNWLLPESASIISSQPWWYTSIVQTSERQKFQTSDLIYCGTLQQGYNNSRAKLLEITFNPASSELTHNCCLPPAMTCGEVCYIERGIHEVTSALHYVRDAVHSLTVTIPGVTEVYTRGNLRVL